MFKIIYKIWKINDLRYKILYTFLLILIYRFVSYIPIPGINTNGISEFMNKSNLEASKGLIHVLSSFTGGAFNRASILALGIMPYISSSIIIQLMGLVIPSIQKSQKDGVSGRQEINKIIRYITIFICLIQAPAYISILVNQLIPFTSLPQIYLLNLNNISDKYIFYIISIITLTSGTLFTMWLGEKITDKGIGNGISLIIMSGILAKLPESLINELLRLSKIKNYIFIIILLLIEIIIWLLIVIFSIMIIKSVRNITIQYVSRIKNNYIDNNIIINNINKKQYIPLKVVSAGVMPIIFAQAIMLLPINLLGYLKNEKIKIFIQYIQDIYGIWYNIIFAILIILFTFFYTAISIPVNQISDDLKRNGGFIPNIKPGKNTVKYIDKILSKITLLGSILLVLIAIIPTLVVKLGVNQNFALFYGGTSLLIIIGVILDTVQYIEAYLLNYYYDGLIKTKLLHF